MSKPSRKKSVSSPPISAERLSYVKQLHRPLNQLVLIGPLLLLVQIGSLCIGGLTPMPQYIQEGLAWLGAGANFLPALSVLVVLVVMHLAHHDRWYVDFWAVLGMIGESLLWVLPIWAAHWLLNSMAPMVAGQVAPAPAAGLGRDILEAVSAGVYEEFIFRLVFFGLVLLVASDLLGLPEKRTTLGLIVISGLIFSLCHFTWVDGRINDFEGARFIFFWVLGAWWGVLFVWRGFGVAVGCHIAWDILVFCSDRL